ncbi:hypothetical protein J5J83_02100 [Azoarcus sp. L1K30]|uniref:hypothetical protein n=1 Tax=Azoarcus sp. L1K30 TaxID=2820277 RepID=UPI001B832352|nr:hypothetical protein [Azoarcus sp. L1K30]MBR0564906.1 hypothetical protein [Azoarcus sp. L1K30]
MRSLAQNSWQNVPYGDDDHACLGDIFALETDALELSSLGVVLGRFDARIGCFERCLLTRSTLRRLEALGGKYFWDLAPMQEHAAASATWRRSASVLLH